MTDDERAVLQAAFDLCEVEHGIELGVLPQAQQHAPYLKLMDACADLAAENDGELRIRENSAVAKLVEALRSCVARLQNPFSDPARYLTCSEMQRGLAALAAFKDGE